jgi:hypothetical protein
MKRSFLSAHFVPFDHVKTTLVSLLAGFTLSVAAFLGSLGADVERPGSYYYGIIPLVHHLHYNPHQSQFFFFIVSGAVQLGLMTLRLLLALFAGFSLSVPFFCIFRIIVMLGHLVIDGPDAPALKVPTKLPGSTSV